MKIMIMEIWISHDTTRSDLNYAKNLYKDLIDIGYVVHYVDDADYIFIPGP
jgi:hypothetical protein